MLSHCVISFQICLHPFVQIRRSKIFEDLLMCITMEMDNDDLDDTEVDEVITFYITLSRCFIFNIKISFQDFMTVILNRCKNIRDHIKLPPLYIP